MNSRKYSKNASFEEDSESSYNQNGGLKMETVKNAIEVTNLVKRYKELVALDHFNLTVKNGEIFGLLGPNG